MARAGLLTGAIMTFAHTVGEFGVVLMIGGNIPGTTKVLSIAIYDFIELGLWPEAHLLAAGMVAFAFVVVGSTMIISRKLDPRSFKRNYPGRIQFSAVCVAALAEEHSR